MPAIMPVSDLKNYTSIINQVSYGNRIYLTKNGRGNCALIDMKELDELDKNKALLQLMSKLNESKLSVRDEGTISSEELEKELGI
ncbi:MAG: type II toxin-antitoxin system prevent-host-death family antitoxin [Lachnospiraceae bacterium]|nr:type II toxin-antitoxin system prevent-host-death family antitoxin [Lachnospiraceae bacterium]